MPEVRAQSFRDLHAGTIEYHIVPHLPYHSFIRGDGFRIETDEAGRPVYLEVVENKCVNGTFVAPPVLMEGSPEELRFLDLRVRYHERQIVYDHHNELLYIDLSESGPARWISHAPSSIWKVSEGGHLAGILIQNINLDSSGHLKMAWRRAAWQSAREADRLRGGEATTPKAISVADVADPA